MFADNILKRQPQNIETDIENNINGSGDASLLLMNAMNGEGQMNDSEIVRLMFNRDEAGLKAASEKYRGYCMMIAENITGSHEEAEECMNDALMQVWELIPPNRPEMLSTYLGKIIRNIAINRSKMLKAQKRGKGAAEPISELSESVRSRDNVERAFERREITREINAFLEALPEYKRNIFVCRYWYCDPVKKIAADWGMTRTAVSVMLHRLRESLCEYLRKRGYDV